MKGLLIKDWKLIVRSKKVYLILLLVAVIFLYNGNKENITFSVVYLIMIFGFLALSTISYDQMDGSNSFYMTLPISRKIYVTEKFLFVIGSILMGWIISVIGTLALLSYNGEGNIKEWIIILISVMLAMVCAISVMIPFRLKFHGDNGRIAFLLAAGLAVAGVNLVIAAKEKAGIDGSSIKENVLSGIRNMGMEKCLLLFLIFTMIVVCAMFRISNEIVRKKEY